MSTTPESYGSADHSRVEHLIDLTEPLAPEHVSPNGARS